MNSLKPFKFQSAKFHLIPSPTDDQPEVHLGQLDFSASYCQWKLSWQNLPLRKDFAIKENVSSAGLGPWSDVSSVTGLFLASAGYLSPQVDLFGTPGLVCLFLF